MEGIGYLKKKYYFASFKIFKDEKYVFGGIEIHSFMKYLYPRKFYTKKTQQKNI